MPDTPQLSAVRRSFNTGPEQNCSAVLHTYIFASLHLHRHVCSNNHGRLSPHLVDLEALVDDKCALRRDIQFPLSNKRGLVKPGKAFVGGLDARRHAHVLVLELGRLRPSIIRKRYCEA